LKGGESQLVIEAGGIFPTTPKLFESKAQQHLFKGGQKISSQLPILPVLDQPYILQYLVKNKENIPLSNKPYFIIDKDGHLQKGVTDDQGFMSIKTTAESQIIVTHVVTNEIEEAQDANGEVEKE
jgi:type VI secretion system secreted protein VgrG